MFKDKSRNPFRFVYYNVIYIFVYEMLKTFERINILITEARVSLLFKYICVDFMYVQQKEIVIENIPGKLYKMADNYEAVVLKLLLNLHYHYYIQFFFIRS
jgi:hypothetical protein